jgi:hypothetical protein
VSLSIFGVRGHAYGFVERQWRSVIISLGRCPWRWWKIKASAESAIHFKTISFASTNLRVIEARLQR